MEDVSSSVNGLSKTEQSTPFSPFSSEVNFNPSVPSCVSSSSSIPFNSSSDVPSTQYFNPSGMPYFPQFPSYPPPVNFPYFPPATVSQWRQIDASFVTPTAYSNNTVLNLPSTFPEGTRKRKARKLYTQAQIDVLVHEFRKNGYVSKEDRVRIGRMTGIAEDKVKIWYQNRRYKEKKEGESTSSEGRRSVSPSEDETKSSSNTNYFRVPLSSECTWLPDLRTPPTNSFAPSVFPHQSFQFFPTRSTPSVYHPYAPPSNHG